MKMILSPFLKRAGISQTELADRTGLSKGFISELNSGKKRPSMKVLNQIAGVLGVDPGALMQPDTQDAEFSEPTVTFTYEPDAVSMPAATADGLQMLAQGARHPSWWLAQRAAPGFGILRGDRIVVDLGAAPAPGDLVLATPEDPDSITLIRRWGGPWLFDDTGSEPPRSSSRGIAILGVIHAVLRQRDHLPGRRSTTS